ncbi:MAG: acetyl-CoA carboxylase carboxyltransferase subunit alpha [Rhodobacteraceae bacterium]|nr:acetyl-CoA carboxylase carboxyltransferase subunit alpha [Paracoccaceae bacterium]
MKHYLEFEKPIAEIDAQITDLKATPGFKGNKEFRETLKRLEEMNLKKLKAIYSKLTPWQKCLVARHADRPHFIDYVNALFTEATPLAGDRNFADDKAVTGLLARFDDHPVVVIGMEKGKDTKNRIHHNFGMARPEGYRKAIRLMELANRFTLPVITLVDTPGAYPGQGAEARGQSEAIARSIEKSLDLEVPMIAIIIGEGGSGGAVALATANRVMMLENSVYSVISPEGCASILWKSSEMMNSAAEALKLTAADLKKFGVIDQIIGEPEGGAHRDPKKTFVNTRKALRMAFKSLDEIDPKQIKQDRYKKFIAMGSPKRKNSKRFSFL